MNIKYIIAALLAASLVAGCASKKVAKPVSVLPVSSEVKEVESTSSTETLLRATGKGSSVQAAIADARKASVWFLLNAGSKPLLKTKDDRRGMRSFENELYTNVDKYIRHTSDLKSKKKIGDSTVVEVMVRVDVQMLTEFLVDNEIIVAAEDISETVGLPTISILAMDSNGNVDVAKNTMGEYLTDRDYEVNVVEQSGKLNKIVGKVAKLSGNVDPTYAWALEAGSDIYLEVKVNTQTGKVSGVATKKASVTAKAFETSTGRQLASSTGHSSERAASGYDALIQEAANGVADKVISQIRKKWLKEVKKGKTFKLVAFSSESEGRDVDAAIYKALKAMASGPVKRIAAGKTSFQYQARVKDMTNAFDLLDKLAAKYRGPGNLEREMESGTLLVVKAGSGDIEIDVD
jgi:uncharacterized lipoprotein YmbA